MVCLRDSVLNDSVSRDRMIDLFSHFAGAKMLLFESNDSISDMLLRAAEIVAKLQSGGLNSLSLCGADLDSVCGSKQGVTHVDINIVRVLLKQDVMPIVAPICHDTEGHLLTVDYRDLVCQYAQAISWHYNVSLMIVDKELDEHLVANGCATVLSLSDYNTRKVGSTLCHKSLDMLFAALENGVQNIFITSPENLGTINGVALVL